MNKFKKGSIALAVSLLAISSIAQAQTYVIMHPADSISTNSANLNEAIENARNSSDGSGEGDDNGDNNVIDPGEFYFQTNASVANNILSYNINYTNFDDSLDTITKITLSNELGDSYTETVNSKITHGNIDLSVLPVNPNYLVLDIDVRYDDKYQLYYSFAETISVNNPDFEYNFIVDNVRTSPSNLGVDLYSPSNTSYKFEVEGYDAGQTFPWTIAPKLHTLTFTYDVNNTGVYGPSFNIHPIQPRPTHPLVITISKLIDDDNYETLVVLEDIY